MSVYSSEIIRPHSPIVLCTPGVLPCCYALTQKQEPNEKTRALPNPTALYASDMKASCYVMPRLQSVLSKCSLAVFQSCLSLFLLSNEQNFRRGIVPERRLNASASIYTGHRPNVPSPRKSWKKKKTGRSLTQRRRGVVRSVSSTNNVQNAVRLASSFRSGRFCADGEAPSPASGLGGSGWCWSRLVRYLREYRERSSPVLRVRCDLAPDPEPPREEVRYDPRDRESNEDSLGLSV